MGRPIYKQIEDGFYPSYESFEKYYIKENHSLKETGEFFKLTKKQIINLIKFFNLHKEKESAILSCARHKIDNNHYPSKEQLEEDYKKTGNWEDVRKKYNISSSTFKRLRYRKGLKREVNEILSDKEMFQKYLAQLNKKETPLNISKKLGVPLSQIYYWGEKHQLMNLMDHFSSSGEEKIREELKGVLFEKDRRQLKPYEIDLFNKERKIGIEFNGDYWHSEKQKQEDYHYKKSIVAEKKGVYLIHIFEQEMKDDPVRYTNFLRNLFVSDKIEIKEEEIRKASREESYSFISLQYRSEIKDYDECYGIFSEGKIVDCLCFKNRGHGNWEITIDFPELDTQVENGYKKILDFFLKEKKPAIIQIECDFNKYNGEKYKELGFSFLGYSGPKILEYSNNLEYKIYGSGIKKYSLYIK